MSQSPFGISSPISLTHIIECKICVTVSKISKQMALKIMNEFELD